MKGNRMTRQRLDLATYNFMHLGDIDSDKTYEFDDAITCVKLNVHGASQGEGYLDARFFSGERELLWIDMKANAISRFLYYPDDNENEERYCADPRIIATYILAAWLDYPVLHVGMSKLEERKKYEDLEKALNPVFTREEALKWLENCGFIGDNRLRDRLLKVHGDKDRERASRTLDDLGDSPGFDIYYHEPRVPRKYLPTNAQKFYDEYTGKYIAETMEYCRRDGLPETSPLEY